MVIQTAAKPHQLNYELKIIITLQL
jgi:hypothetical protein